VNGTGGVLVVSLAAPARPLIRRVFPGVRGATAVGARFLTWGADGLFDGAHRVQEEPVAAVVGHGGNFYVLGERGIAIYDQRLQRIGALPTAGREFMVASGNRLVVATPAGLDLIDLSVPGGGRTTTFPLDGVRSLESTTIGGKRFVLVERPGSFSTIDVGAARPTEVAAYHDRPWFAGAVMIDGLIVRPTADRRGIEIFTAGRRGHRVI